MKPLLWTTVFGLAIAIAPCQTQTESVAFEVATIKLPDPTSSVVAGTSFSPRRFTGVGTLRELVQTAYGVQDYQVSGGPAWVRLERLVVDGRSANPVPHDRMMIMLQTLFKERFKLELHRETKVLPIYSLMQGALVRGRNRTKLREVEDKSKAGGMASGKGMLRGQMTLSDLARYLAPVTGRPVLDRTGLTPAFEINLQWSADDSADTPTSGPSIFTAIQEQLGLRLVSAKGPVEILVIDHVDRPSEN